MATQLKIRRGTTAEHASFTGAEGEITLDTTKDTLVAHDNYTAGGRPMLREDLNNLANSSIGVAKIDHGSASAHQVVKVNAAANGIEFGHQEIGQVKYAHFGGGQNIASTAYTDVTNLSIDITPKSTASRFLIMLNIQAYWDNYGQMMISRDGSNLFSPTATHGSGNGTGDPYRTENLMWLDHPNTTSSVNYKGRVAMYSGQVKVGINSPNNSGCSLVVWELTNYS